VIPHHYDPLTQSRGSFEEVYRRAWARRLLLRFSAWIRHCCSPAERANLGLTTCFEEERNETYSRSRLGLREVELGEIAGSTSRCRDFDQSFIPLRRGLEDRWNQVCRALCAGKVLPPVSLYKVGDAYFVRDGNHRVSVSRYRGVQTGGGHRARPGGLPCPAIA
jgi:hypothetical protein